MCPTVKISVSLETSVFGYGWTSPSVQTEQMGWIFCCCIDQKFVQSIGKCVSTAFLRYVDEEFAQSTEKFVSENWMLGCVKVKFVQLAEEIVSLGFLSCINEGNWLSPAKSSFRLNFFVPSIKDSLGRLKGSFRLNFFLASTRNLVDWKVCFNRISLGVSRPGQALHRVPSRLFTKPREDRNPLYTGTKYHSKKCATVKWHNAEVKSSRNSGDKRTRWWNDRASRQFALSSAKIRDWYAKPRIIINDWF